MAEYENILDLMLEHDVWYVSKRVAGTRFFDHFWMGREFLTAATYYFTSLTHMKEYCKTRFPNNNDGKGSIYFYDHCALAHSNERGNIESIPHQIFFDFEDMAWSKEIRKYIDYICDGILAIGVLMNLFKYNLS